MRENRMTAIILIVCAVLWAGIVLRESAAKLGTVVFEETASQDDVERYARARLTELQRRSFDEDVELCGMIAEDSSGELVSQTITVGDNESCDIASFELYTLLPLATFHTHAAFNRDYDSEVPSLLDLESDIDAELDGYISTPGGRFWRNDWQAGVARQVCGEGCLPQDVEYLSCDAPPPAGEYTLKTLRAREDLPWSGC